MSHIPFTILAYLLNAVSVTVDKFLIEKHIPDPLIYTFYLSVVSFAALILIPFAHIPTSPVFVLTSVATLLWTTGAYFLFKSLQIGQVSRVIPIIGTLIPIILLTESIINQTLSSNQVWAVGILILGIIFLTAHDLRGKLNPKEFLFEVLSSIFFAVSYIVLREAYLLGDFWTVFVWGRPILIPVGLLILAIPKTRNIVFPRNSHTATSSDRIKSNPILNLFKSKVAILFVIGQATAGISELLLTFSVSLANPALVNSLQGTQFAFLFLMSGALSKKYPEVYQEKLSFLAIALKITGIILLAGGLYILAFAKPDTTKKIPVGVTFSPKYAQSLGLDPQKTYLQTLDDLKIKNLRFPLYWDEIEKTPHQFNFTSQDFYLNEAQKRGVSVILVVGYKQPRWPECFAPAWVKKLTVDQRNQQVLNLVTSEVNHFKKYPNIISWQVENEPFLYFGTCDSPQNRKELLTKEVEIVRNSDPRPVLITDSGELSSWFDAFRAGDWFGSTLYRSVWGPIFGSVDYPLPPLFYKAKASLIGLLTGSQDKPIIISELQTEPWAKAKLNITQIPIDEQVSLFPPQKINSNLNYAKEVGFGQVYFWGVEWWYWMSSHNHPEYINQAKILFTP